MMFVEVEKWINSGLSKSEFLEDKSFSEAKFNYWLVKWKSSQQVKGSVDDFRELSFSQVNVSKVLEIQTPTGLRITVFG